MWDIHTDGLITCESIDPYLDKIIEFVSLISHKLYIPGGIWPPLSGFWRAGGILAGK